MAVVEYKEHVLYKGDHRRHIPGFIDNGGHWYRKANHSFIGWVKENPEYYVPWTTLNVLTKEAFVQRTIGMHNVEPILIQDPNNPGSMIPLASEAEVRAHAEQWYDNFVAVNQAADAGN